MSWHLPRLLDFLACIPPSPHQKFIQHIICSALPCLYRLCSSSWAAVVRRGAGRGEQGRLRGHGRQGCRKDAHEACRQRLVRLHAAQSASVCIGCVQRFVCRVQLIPAERMVERPRAMSSTLPLWQSETCGGASACGARCQAVGLSDCGPRGDLQEPPLQPCGAPGAQQRCSTPRPARTAGRCHGCNHCHTHRTQPWHQLQHTQSSQCPPAPRWCSHRARG